LLPLTPLATHVSGVRFLKNVKVPTRDGTVLAMDMHVPAGGGPFPVILEYIPYRKDDITPFTGYHDYYARHGFIGARIDCRGTGSSEGSNDDEYRPVEQQDGYDAIEWIAEQDWSTGKIAMIGSSYGGFTSVQVAAIQPPHLTTIVPQNFTDDRYTDDCHYRGGALRCYYDIGSYGSSMTGMNSMPPYPEYSGSDWARLWEEHLEHNDPYLLTWLAHQTDGDYWKPGSVRGRYEDIRCPVLMVCGWRDGYVNVPLRMAEHLTVPYKVLMGPWNHSGPDSTTPGPSIDRHLETVRWCDYWLKGVDNGVMDEPTITVYMQSFDLPEASRTHTTGYWRSESSLPTGESRNAAYSVGAGGVLTPVRSETLNVAHDEAVEQVTQRYDEYTYRPTVGIASGLWSAGVPFGLPTDQRVDEAYSLNYTTEPLGEPIEIIGTSKARLFLSSTAPVMAFVARLSDVAPDGTSVQVAIGVLNGTRRDSLTDPAPIKPSEVYEMNIDLDATAWRFEKGHRIRLSVSSADFPNLWPTPYNGANRLYRGSDRPSQLSIPIVPLRVSPDGKLPSDEASFEPPETVRGSYRFGPEEIPWEIRHDVLRDRVGLRMHTSTMSHPNDATSITLDSDLDVWASNRDPSNVSAMGKHHRHIARTDGTIDVDTTTSLRSTVTDFHVAIDLEIRMNGQMHHQRRWVETFPRVLL
jgi:putative CocE/NonD family hydrolase